MAVKIVWGSLTELQSFQHASKIICAPWIEPGNFQKAGKILVGAVN